jgi:uncharacterized protein (TIGR00288 family)
MHIALLIDCENASADSIHSVVSELLSRGIVNIRRAYGNWKLLPSWESKLRSYAIQPIQQFAYTPGKNAADMSMTVDAMELLFTEKVDVFALMTSDSDFTPLAMKLQAKGKHVIGFGRSTTPESFRMACTAFIFTDTSTAALQESGTTSVLQVAEPGAQRTRNELRGDTQLMNALRAAVDATAGEDGWAPMPSIGQHITQNAKLYSKSYGYARWPVLIRATEYFDEGSRGEGHAHFRRKPPPSAG